MNRIKITCYLSQTTRLGAGAHGFAVFLDNLLVTLPLFILFLIYAENKLDQETRIIGFLACLCGYLLFKDLIILGRSIGKRMAGCYVVDKNTGLLCPWWKNIIRILISLILFPFEFFAKFFTWLSIQVNIRLFGIICDTKNNTGATFLIFCI